MIISKKRLEELIQKRLNEQKCEFERNRDIDYTFRNIRDDYDRLNMRIANLEHEIYKLKPGSEEVRTCNGI